MNTLRVRLVACIDLDLDSHDPQSTLGQALQIQAYWSYLQSQAPVVLAHTARLPRELFNIAILKDPSLSSARVAKEFCFAARDVLLLYRAIVPVQLEKQFDSLSQVAAIVHNDFYHLSQEILGLAFQYRADFPSDLQKHVVFVDLAPIFSQMAGAILRRQIQLTVDTISEAIDGAEGFQNTHQPQHYESAKFSIEQVLLPWRGGFPPPLQASFGNSDFHATQWSCKKVDMRTNL
ncbi:Centromere/kinetochore protein zw10 [Zea mays]|uniref:Centromere/kinetochore protein zw10 n=1 Tax=Zea mays TaxID=4577 RepID=A0A3L6G1J5_MAIZE|nr:Centromere/kinetochore protein zw10 [Zea mays]